MFHIEAGSADDDEAECNEDTCLNLCQDEEICVTAELYWQVRRWFLKSLHVLLYIDTEYR